MFVLVLVIMSSQLPIFNFDLKDLPESCNDSAIDNFGTDLMNNIIDKETEYFLPDQLNNEISLLDEEYISLMHINCRSLNKNFDTMSEFLDLLKCKVDFILLSETWLPKGPDCLLSLAGYEYYVKGRLSRGGGVGIFAKTSFRIKERTDLSVFNANIESYFIEVVHSNSKNLIIAVICRPPSQSCVDFIIDLNNILEKVGRENKTCYFLGDFNLNLLDVHFDQHVNSFLEMVFSHSYAPLITKATRIVQSSSTLIDNIFVNDTSLVLKSGILLADISDHLPIFVFNRSKHNEWLKRDQCNKTYSRDMCRSNFDKFRVALTEHSWEYVMHEESCDRAYEVFLSEFNIIHNSCFPLKEKRCRKRESKPWITKAILKSCKKKIKLYKKYLKNPSVYRKKVYRQYRNTLTSIIRRSKES